MSTLENNFIFVCDRLSITQPTIKSITLPDITLGEPEYVGRQQDIKIPGHKFVFGNIEMEFILNEDFSNHKEIYTWLTDIRSYKGQALINQFSDASVQILSNNKQPLENIKITGMFPTSLGQVDFRFAGVTGDPLFCNASFAITDWRYDLG